MTERYDIWKCNSCKAEHIDERDIDSRCVFGGSLEEPAEYEDRCPDCGSTDIEEMPWCDACGDVRVFDDGDLCETCYLESVAHLEERHNIERGIY